jgi:hypothetical protein
MAWCRSQPTAAVPWDLWPLEAGPGELPGGAIHPREIFERAHDRGIQKAPGRRGLGGLIIMKCSL